MVLPDFLLRVMADWLVIVVLAIGAASVLRVPKQLRYQAVARGVMTGILALFFAGIARLLYQDGQRPFELLGVNPGAAYLDNPGFPSDHALFVFTITLVVWAMTKNKTIALVLLVLSTLIGLGRILALVHTPADVMAGIGCAVLAAVCLYGRSLFRSQ